MERPMRWLKRKTCLRTSVNGTFGDKTGISAGTTNIELIFDFNKDKMSASK
jgi:hypothetical protein